MSFWFRTYREHSDDPQNSMFAEIYRLLLQTRTDITGTSSSNSDLDRKRVDIIPTESYIIIVAGKCFVHAAQRHIWSGQRYYSAREPDGVVCRCWHNFDYRNPRLTDKSLCGNNALLKGLPVIAAYQPEYMSSSLKVNGSDAFADMGNTANLRVGEGTGASVRLDGIDGFIDLGENALWQQTMTKISFSFWINPEAMYDIGFRNLTSMSDGDNYIGVFFSSGADVLSLQVTNDGFGTTGDAETANLTTANQWYYIHATYDSTLGSNQLKLYLDKTLVGQATYTGSLTFDSTTLAQLGKYIFDTDGFSHKGLIKDFRLWVNRANSQTDVNNVGDNNSSAPAPDYWLQMEEGFSNPRDYLNRRNYGSLENGATWSIDTPAVWVSTEMTVAFWFYVPTTPVSAAYIVSRGSTNSYAAYVDTDGEFKAQFFYFDGTNAILDSNTVVTGGWHRGLLTHSKKNAVSKIFVDGVLKASNTKNDYLRDSGNTSSSRFLIGAKATGASTQSNYTNGNIDDVKVWKRQLTDADAMDDFLGEAVSTKDLVSEWTFDEDESSTQTLDSQSYNTGTILNTVYDKTQVPTQLEGPIPYQDGVVNYLVGYRTTGQQFLIIPELSDDFRITDRTTGGAYYAFLLKLTTFDTVNNNYMRLMQKADDFNGDYIQSIQIRDDGRLYIIFKFNGSEKKVRSVDPLKLRKLYYVKVGIDFSWVASGNPLDIFSIYLNGVKIPIEVTTDASELPAAADINDFHTYLFSGSEELRGNFIGHVYQFRYYQEKLTDELALNLATNKFTTYRLDRGTIVQSNLTKLPETSPYRPAIFTFPAVPISEIFDYQITDTVYTARFDNVSDPIDISDEFDYTLSGAGGTSLGNYSLTLNGTSAFVEVPTITPISKHFSLSVWVKYLGNTGGWGGVISRIDGLPNGNRLLLQPTVIRWHGQFNSHNASWKDIRVTVPDISNAYHHIGIMYDGGDPDTFKIMLDGTKVLQRTIDGPIISGESRDNGKTYIGKGADNSYYLNGLIDDMIVYNITLTEAQMRSNYLRSRTSVGTMAYWKFEGDVKDSHNGFHGTRRGGADYSTVTP